MSRKLYLGERKSIFARRPKMFSLRDVPREDLYVILSHTYDTAIANAYDRYLMSLAHDEALRESTEEHLMRMYRFINENPDAEFYAE